MKYEYGKGMKGYDAAARELIFSVLLVAFALFATWVAFNICVSTLPVARQVEAGDA